MVAHLPRGVRSYRTLSPGPPTAGISNWAVSMLPAGSFQHHPEARFHSPSQVFDVHKRILRSGMPPTPPAQPATSRVLELASSRSPCASGFGPAHRGLLRKGHLAKTTANGNKPAWVHTVRSASVASRNERAHNLHPTCSNGFSGEDIEHAEAYAQGVQGFAPWKDSTTAMESRTTIDVAVGAIMAQSRCSQEFALNSSKSLKVPAA